MAKKIRIIPELDDSKILKQLRNLGNRREKVKVDVDSGNIRNANQQMQQLVTTTVNSNTTFKKLKNTISDTFSSDRLSMFGFLTVLHEISKAGKEAKKTIQDIDKAITDLSIATNMSREATAGLAKEYNSYAKELKSTTTQITSAADDYLRAGKSMSETKKLIEDSIMLSKLGQLETPEATEDLLATMNGFEMSVEEVGSALDAMVAIDMEAATSAGDIATALKYSASSADMAGLSFNKLASMIGTVQDKTQQSAETVGTFMNTLLSRYRNVKIGQFVSDDGEDLSEVETILKSLDIKLRDSNQEFRNFEMVIDEVALKWDTYSSVQKSAIAKAFSGTRQQNRFIALMEGYRKVLELTEVAANSAGTALEKFNNSYKNSLEAKQNTLQASFESMVMNSDMEEVYSGILEATTALVDFINHTNALKGVMTGLAVSGGVKGFLTIRTAINESYIALNQFSNALKLVKQTNISTADFDKLLLLTKNLSDSQMKMVLSSNALGLKQKELLLVNSGLSKEEAQLQLQTWGLTTAQTGLTVTTTTLGNAFKGLWATLVANPFMTLTMVISGLTMAYQSYNQKLEETRQKNIEASESAIDHANSLKDLYTEYSRLSVIQDRSSAEEESFKTVVEDVTKALGDKAKVLEGLTAGTNEYADALANATKEELQSASVDATIGRKSAEEELQADIWSEWKGSKVSVDSNGTGQSLSEEAQRAVNIVSDALKDFETVNKTWNNLSWDISSDNPEEAFEFYNALIKAREDLVLASENDEALFDTEIYKDMNTAISAMSDSLESYISKRYEEEKLNYMATNGIPQTTEEYKAMQDSLMATAGASVDLQDSFKSLLMSDFSSLANEIEGVSEAQSELEDSLPDGGELVSTISTSVKQIATQLEPQFAKLGEAYKEIFTEEGFALDNVDNSMLEELRKSFAEIEEEVGVSFDATQLNEFFDVLTNGESTVEQVQQSFNDLATSYFYSTDTLANLNDETAESIRQQLAEMGVVNANEVVTNALALQKERLAQASKISSETTYEHAVELMNEAGASEIAGMALAQLALEKIHVNGQTISTSADIENIIALANAAGASAEALATLTQAKAILAGGDAYGRTLQDWASNVLSQINNGTYEYGFNLDADDFKVDFKGVGKDSASKAGKDAGEAYKDAVEQELNNLDSVINAVGDLISDHIDHLQDQCDAAVDSLERERDAIIDGLEAEKKALEDAVEAKQDQIDTIREAREERSAELNLQRKEYELERLQNQRTRLIYSESKGFHYETTSNNEIRNAKEAVDEAKEEIEILKIEKEISVLEDSIDNIDDKIEEVNNHYDELIEQTKNYYDQLIEGLENYKSRWEELGELKEQAEFKRQLEELGLSSVDILNMSEEAFQAFKTQYVDALDKYLQATGEGLDAIADTDLTSTADSVSKVADATTQIDDTKVANLSSAMDSLSNTSNLDLLYDAFSQLKDVIGEISDTLNGVDKAGGLVNALEALTQVSLGTTGEEASGLIGQFVALKDAINAASSAINGDGSSGGQNLPQGGAPTKQGSITPSGSPDSGGTGGTGGLTQAIQDQVEQAEELLPKEIDLFGGEEDSLVSAVTKVTTAVAGGGESEGEENSSPLKTGLEGEGEADTSNLMGAIQAQYDLASEKIPEETNLFNELKIAIEECVKQLERMVALLEQVGESGGGTTIGGFHAQGTVGKAFAKGYNGLPHSEKNALRSEYGQPELTVYPDGTTELTTEPTMSDLPKDTVIFNEEQTRRIMKNKGTVLGNAYADGTNAPIVQTPTNLPPYLRELQEGDRMYDLLQKMDAHRELLQNSIVTPVNSIQKNMDMITRNINNVNTNNTMQNVTNFSTGDIVVQGVQDVDSLAYAIKTRFPNAMIQAMHTTR